MIAPKTNITLATVKYFVPLMAVISFLFVIVANLYAEVDKAKTGQADRVFDKEFLQSIKNVLFYEQIVKIVGVQGVKVGNSNLKIPGDKYHWNGSENTKLNIRVVSGKVIDGNVVTPAGRIITLEVNGEINELGK
ncbi:hypothetical protein KI809_02140 [Geobacter pelophilus]|uniref:Uncharacterized protein n=1 Tax=Geoanaerobacter pelophilus TaxID=60036 RepID=A0AAW4KX19_9BACT|nr:hypothetical protein [Geoanaerobacter pelophilus]MBT0663088.1 hypothetical protein [Geoanaerobacter pelophilus]